MSLDPRRRQLVDGFVDGTLDDVQLADLKRLLQSDPALRETMTTEYRLRGLVRAARNPSRIADSVAAAIEGLTPERHEEQIVRQLGMAERSRSGRRFWRAWALPAALAAGVLAVVGLTVRLSLHQAPPLADGWQVTPTGDARYRVVQPDLIRLERGELFVRSTHATARPALRIETPNGLATAQGTSFYIGAHAEEKEASNNTTERIGASMTGRSSMTRVLVLTGVVMLANAHGEATGKADQLLAAESGKPPVHHALAANGDFAADLYAALSREHPGRNLFFSPYSLSSALAMTAEGARGETAAEMGKVLRYPAAARRVGTDAQVLPWNTALIHTGMKALNERFQTKPVPQELRDKLAAARQALAASQAQEKEFEAAGKWNLMEEQRKKSEPFVAQVNTLAAQVDQYEIRVANALYGEQTHPFRQEYLDTISTSYGTGAVVPVDFIHQFEAARLHINGWVEQQTHERIKDLLTQGSLDSLTCLVLVNAIYFKGDWAVPFDEEQTTQEDFLAGAGRKIGVQMMRKHKLEGGRYGAFKADGTPFATPTTVSAGSEVATCYPGTGGFLVAELPYKGKELSMVLVVPQDADGLEAVEKQLTGASLRAWLGTLEDRALHVQMPRFRLKTDFQEMRKTLEALGMRQAFMPAAANFTGMCASDKAELCISRVVHKAFVEVTERGTEAAAATAVVMLRDDRPKVPFTPTVRADRPFLFAIRDVQTGTLLFLGRMMDPSGTEGP